MGNGIEREVFRRRRPDGGRDLFLILVDVAFHLLLFLLVPSVLFLVSRGGARVEEGVTDGRIEESPASSAGAGQEIRFDQRAFPAPPYPIGDGILWSLLRDLVDVVVALLRSSPEFRCRTGARERCGNEVAGAPANGLEEKREIVDFSQKFECWQLILVCGTAFAVEVGHDVVSGFTVNLCFFLSEPFFLSARIDYPYWHVDVRMRDKIY